MIYDAFLFFNELDLLEIRLSILDPYVDYFVISESTVTFSGLKKPLYYLENKDRFKKFEHKIIHKIVDHTPKSFIDTTKFLIPETENTSKEDKVRNKILRNMMNYNHWNKEEVHWGRDFYQRECVLIGLANCNDDDIIILSDLDEIPNPEVIKDIDKTIPKGNFCHLMQKLYYYYINNLVVAFRWYGPKTAHYSFIKNIDSNGLRLFKNSGIQIENGGWHFSFMGGKDKIRTKIESYGHQELNNDSIKNNISYNVDNNISVIGGNLNFQVVPIDDTYPKYLLDNLYKYPHFVKR